MLMDSVFQPLIDVVIQYALWMIPLVIGLAALKALLAPKVIGMEGKALVAGVLNRLGEAVLHDIVIPNGKGGLTQIDHVALTATGLLVVETKNYSGLILGTEREPQWTQQIGKTTHRFQNPLHQNALHMAAIQRLQLGVPVHGRVVFTDGAKFPKGRPAGVSQLSSLREDVRNELGDGTPGPTLLVAWDQLKQQARTDRAAKQAHLAGIAQKHGKDRRRPVAWAMLGISALWLAALWIARAPSSEREISPMLFAEPRLQSPSPAPPREETRPPEIAAARTALHRILGYREEWVPGRPIEECVGADKELNEDVLRCRHGYSRKVPVYGP